MNKKNGSSRKLLSRRVVIMTYTTHVTPKIHVIFFMNEYQEILSSHGMLYGNGSVCVFVYDCVCL